VKAFFNSLRVLLLVGSLLLTAQASLVHAYSHTQRGTAASTAKDPDRSVHEPLCSFCLALNQFDSALPSQHNWCLAAYAVPDGVSMLARPASAAPVAARLARGPPVQS